MPPPFTLNGSTFLTFEPSPLIPRGIQLLAELSGSGPGLLKFLGGHLGGTAQGVEATLCGAEEYLDGRGACTGIVLALKVGAQALE